MLDLFCCAGGAAMGYRRAGFDVVGVDIDPQPRYPFEFHQGDALKFLLEHHGEFDAFHASPPCQAYTLAQRIQGNDHPDFIAATRSAFELIGKPWVIENVPGSPLNHPVTYCGASFPGLRVYRHRLFESSIPLTPPTHAEHSAPPHEDGPPTAGRTLHARRRELHRCTGRARRDGHPMDDPRRAP
ncbi:DNA cytosine methyltransferase [Cellulomonas denverensis]|uniref:DNA cytosine methyltransferase n=1 Tax=Cellulomonas denverensis TaxID=264297 RepID=UPI0035ED71F7